MMRLLMAALAGAIWLSGCAANPREMFREPALSPVGSGMVVEQTGGVHPVVHEAFDGPGPVGVRSRGGIARNSTWRDTSADLFRDARAGRVGDVITVKIAMKDKASLDNSSNRTRDSKTGVGGTLKYALAALGLSGSGDADVALDMKGATSTQGKGAISRSESIDLMLAAVVTDILPNGNLVISGTQEVRVNFEVRVLNVAGIVRPQDVGAENSISYDKIAEARISYGGRGRITEVQQPGWGQQIIDTVSPY